MLLLLLLGASTQAPIVVGVRAYGHTSFSAVTPSATGLTSVTSATTTEE